MKVSQIVLSPTNKKMQKLAKANGFSFDWNSKTWKHREGVEMSENHSLFAFAAKAEKPVMPTAKKRMTYSEAYDRFGLDFAEEGNY
jgi:hypothetical protein